MYTLIHRPYDQFGDRRVAVQAFVYINLVNGRLNIYVSMVNVVVR